jgi:hypothetical protein
MSVMVSKGVEKFKMMACLKHLRAAGLRLCCGSTRYYVFPSDSRVDVLVVSNILAISQPDDIDVAVRLWINYLRIFSDKWEVYFEIGLMTAICEAMFYVLPKTDYVK